MRIPDSDRENRLVEVQNDDRRKVNDTDQVLVSNCRVRCDPGRRGVHDDRQFANGAVIVVASTVFARSHADCARSPTRRVARQRADLYQPQPRSV